MSVKLKNHYIWDEFDKIIAEIDINDIVKQHLESCHYKVSGYWDGKNEFYEEIAFVSSLRSELSSSSLGTTLLEGRGSHWIKLRLLLKADTSASEGELNSDDDEIGELILILDDNLKVVDENWLIDVESPFVVAKRQKDLPHYA